MSVELYPELKELYEIIRQKRIRLGHPNSFGVKQRKNTTFSSDTRYLVGMCGILPYRVNTTR